jgi:hypothetical protein
MNLNYQSQIISCDHISKLNDKYNNNNNTIFKRKLFCYDDDNINNDDYNHYKKYLDSIYISRKSCIYKSTEPDELHWTSVFNDDNNNNNNNNNINERTLNMFNENTRRKILTRY